MPKITWEKKVQKALMYSNLPVNGALNFSYIVLDLLIHGQSISSLKCLLETMRSKLESAKENQQPDDYADFLVALAFVESTLDDFMFSKDS